METAVPPTSKTFYPLIHSALRHWHKPEDPSAYRWRSFLLIKLGRQPSKKDGAPCTLKEAIAEIIRAALTELEQRFQPGALVLTQRFFEQQTIRQVSIAHNVSVDEVNRTQKKGLRELAKIISGQENSLRTTFLAEIEQALPPPSYSQLIGQLEVQNQILERLLQIGSPWILAITGIGGIGKTALADAVARRAVQTFAFQNIAWVRVESFSMSGEVENQSGLLFDQVLASLAAKLLQNVAPLNRQQQMAGLTHLFKSLPWLVIIDNLESKSGAASLFDQLKPWTNPSKFLLTSRARPFGQRNVWTQSLDELSLADILALIRQEAARLDLAELAQSKEDDLLPVYNVTGGNPLALKLTVGLAQVMPLATILAEFAHSRTGPTEEMYCHIYWRAWRALSEAARQLLLAMPLIAKTGAQPEQMQAMSELDDDQFWTAVRELVSRSLLEVRGTTWDRRYGIHRLTESFLQTEIIHWPTDNFR